MKTKYQEKLLDPRWQKRRLEILSRDNWACQRCGETTLTLHVHHRYYTLGAEPWDYPCEALTTLCEPCHEKAHTEARSPAMHFARLIGVVAERCDTSKLPPTPLPEEIAKWAARRAFLTRQCAEISRQDGREDKASEYEALAKEIESRGKQGFLPVAEAARYAQEVKDGQRNTRKLADEANLLGLEGTEGTDGRRLA